MDAKKFSHTHSSTVCGLKKLASGVFPESWKVLAERRRRRRRRRKRTKNNKSPGYPGWLNKPTCFSPHYGDMIFCVSFYIPTLRNVLVFFSGWQISQCTCPISHTTPFCNRMCTGVHISVTKWCIVGCLSTALLGVWVWTIACRPSEDKQL